MNIGAEPCWEGGRRIGTYDLGDNHAVVLAIAHVAATVGAGRPLCSRCADELGYVAQPDFDFRIDGHFPSLFYGEDKTSGVTRPLTVICLNIGKGEVFRIEGL